MAVRANPVRIAVVGLNHGRFLARAVRANGEAELVGVCTRNPDRHLQELERLQAPLFPDIETLIYETAPEGIVIAAPTDYLVPMAKSCLARNVHVLVEKPLGVSVASVLELKRAAELSEAKVVVGYYRRLSRQVVALRSLLDRGVIGEVLGVSCKWMIQKPTDYFRGWKASRSRGGGCLMINFIHDFDLLQSLFGPIQAVAAMQGGVPGSEDLEHFLAIQMRFAQGQIATAMLSDQCPSPYSYENTVMETTHFPRYPVDSHHFFGTLGSLAFPSFTLYSSPSPRSSWRDPLAMTVASSANETTEDPLALEIEHFLTVVRQRAQPHATIDDALRNLAVVEAVRRSLDSRRIETICIHSSDA